MRARWSWIAAAGLVALAIALALRGSDRRSSSVAGGATEEQRPQVIAEELLPLAEPSTPVVPITKPDRREALDAQRVAQVTIEGQVLVDARCNTDPFAKLDVLHIGTDVDVPIAVDQSGRFRAELRLPETKCTEPLSVALDDPAGNRWKRRVPLVRDETSADRVTRHRGHVTFELPKWCLLLGTLVTEEDAPVAQAAVGLFPENGFQPLVQGTSGPDGAFALQIGRGLELLLVADDLALQPVLQSFDTTDVGLWDLGRIVLPRGEIVTGIVVCNELERRYSDLNVQARLDRQGVDIAFGTHQLAHDGHRIWRSHASALVRDGAFELTGLERAEYRLELGLPFDRLRLVERDPLGSFVVAAPAAGIVFDPGDPEVWIAVRDHETGTPVTAELQVESTDPSRSSSTRGSDCVIQARTGTIYRVSARAAGYEPGRIDIVGPALGGYSEQVLELRRTAAGDLILRVGDDSLLVGHARVSLDASGSDWIEVKIVRGRVRLDGLPAGDYRGMVELKDAAGIVQQLPFEARVEADEICERTLVR